ncbi:MAG: AlpA family phage regulatory protein [Gammaproteobacteria bacterium]|nr:AlpA family phage regulatory protein [Gammaproteobacteria bacterium]
MQTQLENVAILRERKVTEITGDSRSSLWAKAKIGLFTPPVKIGPRAIGWPAGEIAAINRARIAGKPDDEIRALVKSLVAARGASA